MYKGIIFDLDGVICFTDQYHYQAWKKLADERDIPFDEEINKRLRGVSRMDSLEIILEKADRTYTDEEKAQMAEEKNDTYRELLGQMSPADLSDEVRDTLRELRNRGFKLAIGSSSKNTKTILARIGLGDFFDATSDGTNITRSKPDPEVLRRLRSLSGRSQRTVWWWRTPTPGSRRPVPEDLTVQASATRRSTRRPPTV